jgi:hypothetical protein
MTFDAHKLPAFKNHRRSLPAKSFACHSPPEEFRASFHKNRANFHHISPSLFSDSPSLKIFPSFFSRQMPHESSLRQHLRMGIKKTGIQENLA